MRRILLTTLATAAIGVTPPVAGQDFDNTGLTEDWFRGGTGPGGGGGQIVTTTPQFLYFDSFSFWVAAAQPFSIQARLALLETPVASGSVSEFDGTTSGYMDVWSSAPVEIEPVELPPSPSPLANYRRVDFTIGRFLNPTAIYAVYLHALGPHTFHLATGFKEADGVVSRDDHWTAWTDTEQGFSGDDRFRAFVADFTSRCGAPDDPGDCVPVPEPPTWPLVLSGVLGLGILALRRRGICNA